MPDGQRQIEVSFQLELADMLAATRFVQLRSSLRWVLPLIVVAGEASAVASRSWSTAVAVLAGVAAAVFMLLYVAPRRSFRANPNMGRTQTWVLNADGIAYEVTDPDGATRMRSDVLWRSVLRMHESRQAFLLSSSNRVFNVLPKRALDAAEVDAVRALLAANVTRASS
jgi:hypothetical protein